MRTRRSAKQVIHEIAFKIILHRPRSYKTAIELNTLKTLCDSMGWERTSKAIRRELRQWDQVTLYRALSEGDQHAMESEGSRRGE